MATPSRERPYPRAIDVQARAIACLVLTVSLGFAEDTGAIQGLVVDPSLAAIADMQVRLMPDASRKTVLRDKTAHDGRFFLTGIEPGIYAIAVAGRGFREKLIEHVRIAKGSHVDLGTVLFEIAACETPGVHCFSVQAASDEPVAGPRPIVARGTITLPVECAADLEKGEAACTVVLDGPPVSRAMRDRTSDFWLRRTTSAQVVLESRNGTRFAAPNATGHECREGASRLQRIRIDGLGPGSDVCIQDKKGRTSRIYFKSEVDPDSREITIYYVRWK